MKRPAAAARGSTGECTESGESSSDADALPEHDPKPKAKRAAKAAVYTSLADEASRSQFRCRIGELPSKSFKYTTVNKEAARKKAKAHIKAECRKNGFPVPEIYM